MYHIDKLSPEQNAWPCTVNTLMQENTFQHQASTSPHRYCAQLMLPSGKVHSLFPSSDPAAPTPICIGSRCSKVGCACLASGLLSKAIMFSSLFSPGAVSAASFSASSKVRVNFWGLESIMEIPRYLRLCTAIP